MARYRGAVCRFCRRSGQKLFLKGDRCQTDKCAFERRAYPPGLHGRSRRQKTSEYGTQLREKQKVRQVYGLLENQFRNMFERSTRERGIVSEVFFKNLECRLDNIIYRMGFARSRNEARQLVRQKHIELNGKVVNIPALQVKVGDEIAVREKSRKMEMLKLAADLFNKRPALSWCETDQDKKCGKIKSLPVRDELGLNVKERLVVELYSK